LTRYQQIEEATADELRRRFLSGDDLEGLVTWLPHDQKRALVVELLDTDRLQGLSAQQVAAPDAELGSMTDYKRAVIAEILLSAQPGVAPSDAEERATVLLVEAGRSPTASPALAYERLYRDLAEGALLEGDSAALDWLLRAVRHNLRYYAGDDVVFQLVDFTSALLQLGDLDRGLAALARLIRHDPRNLGIYHFMATGFAVLGLARLGLSGARKGLALLEETDNDEALHDEFLMAQVELRTARAPGRESQAGAKALAQLEAALSLDFDAGEPASPDALAAELLPELEAVPVKRPLRFEDLPESLRAWANGLSRKAGR